MQGHESPARGSRRPFRRRGQHGLFHERDDSRHSNTSNGEVAKSLNLQSHLPNSSNVSIPVIDDKRAFVIGSSGLVGIDLVTRKKLWTVEGAFSGIPVAAHGTVFVVQQGYLRAMDAATGEPKGAFETGEPISEQPIVTDDSIILASNRTTFIFDRTTKELVGTLPIGGRISIANNAFYVATEGLINAFAINPKSAWQNPSESLDVNGDGSISPLDVLVLVNKLNTTGSIRLDSRPPDSYFLDVDGDGFLTPLDPLIVINWVNSTAGLAEGESTSENNSHSQKNALNEVMVDTIFGHKSWLDDDSLVGKRTGKIRYASIGRPPGS